MPRPRVGFLGVGWIGRHRMEAILATGAVEVAGIADASAEMAAAAATLAPGARLTSTLDELLDLGLDAVVIATPSALHAAQSIRALECGAAVFCQKPLGRTAAEAHGFATAADAAGLVHAVGFSWRRLAAVEAITPEDIAERYRARGGAIYGTSSSGRRAAFLRPGNRGPRRGLYLVGGSSHPGGGLPLVARSGAIVARMVGDDARRRSVGP